MGERPAMTGDQSYERDFSPTENTSQSRFNWRNILYVAGGAAGVVVVAVLLALLWGATQDNPEVGLVEVLTETERTDLSFESETPFEDFSSTGGSLSMAEAELPESILSIDLPESTAALTSIDAPLAVELPPSPNAAPPEVTEYVPPALKDVATLVAQPEEELPTKVASTIPIPLPKPGWVTVAKVDSGHAIDSTIAEGMTGSITEGDNAEQTDNPPTETPTASADVEPAGATTKTNVATTTCDLCPQMVAIPAGTFNMGSPNNEPRRYSYEGPQRTVAVKAFHMSAHEVTFDEWDACVADGACKTKGNDHGWGRGKRPALGVSWNDAQTYAKWLSGKTGKSFRLPTEAEWEYAARGGTASAYWWGPEFDAERVSRSKSEAVGSHDANAFGLYDMLGNAREWIADCYVPTYQGAPTDGSAVSSGTCTARVIRGGYWASNAADSRSANRARIGPTMRTHYMGFRLVMDP